MLGIGVFKCTICGLCCKLSPITLLSFEETILHAAANEMNIRILIRPGYTIYDKKNKVFLGLSYIMELINGKCPFLHNGKCLIHGLYKPYICRSFPYTPKEVRYVYSSEFKVLTSYVEYGLSLKCPVIEKDKDKINYLLKYKPYGLTIYMPNEVKAAMEMEEKRNLILKLLSELWRKGIVEFDPDIKPDDPDRVINVYEFLRTYYPNLPYVLGIPKILSYIRSIRTSFRS